MSDEVNKPRTECLFKDNGDAICNHLAHIVDDRDGRMLAEFDKQNTIIRVHNKEVIDLLTTQHKWIQDNKTDIETNVKPVLDRLVKNDTLQEKRLRLLENFINWHGMIINLFISVILSSAIVLALLEIFE